jgi:hypothetical protein
MRKHLIMAGLLAATVPGFILAPQIAAAQDRCEQIRNDNRVAGTVVGAVGGALLGSAIGGRGHKGGGALVGALAGGVVGNQVAGSRDPCPDGYQPVDAPTYGLHQHEADLDQRIRGARDSGQLSPREADRALDRLNDIRRQEGDMRDRNGGGLGDRDRAMLNDELADLEHSIPWRAAPPPPPPPVYDDWSMAPLDLHEREAWIDRRIHDRLADGALNPDDARRLTDQLRWIRDEEYWYVQDHGVMTREYERSLLAQLDNLVQRFRHVSAR